MKIKIRKIELTIYTENKPESFQPLKASQTFQNFENPIVSVHNTYTYLLIYLCNIADGLL